MKKHISTKYNFLYVTLGVFLIFFAWIISSAIVNNEYTLPSVTLTFKALGSLLIDARTWELLGSSFLKIVIVLIAALTLSFAIVFIDSKLKKTRVFLKPLMVLIKTTPTVVFIVLFLIYFGKEFSLYALTFAVSFPIIYEGMLNGYDSINDEIKEYIKLESGLSLKVYAQVYTPIAMPNIVASILASFGLSLKVLVMAEYLIQPKNSIGYELQTYLNLTNEMEYVFAWAMILVLIIIVSESFMKLIVKKYQD